MSNMQFDTGTVAVATVRGVPNVRVFRYECPSGDLQWDSAAPVEGQIPHLDQHVTDVRPLVVLDIADWTWLPNRLRFDGDSIGMETGRKMRDLADQIEEQTKPPKPEEPTAAGSMVEDRDGVLWAKTAWGLWTDLNYMSRDRKWCDIDAVKVIRS